MTLNAFNPVEVDGALAKGQGKFALGKFAPHAMTYSPCMILLWHQVQQQSAVVVLPTGRVGDGWSPHGAYAVWGVGVWDRMAGSRRGRLVPSRWEGVCLPRGNPCSAATLTLLAVTWIRLLIFAVARLFDRYQPYQVEHRNDATQATLKLQHDKQDIQHLQIFRSLRGPSAYSTAATAPATTHQQSHHLSVHC